MIREAIVKLLTELTDQLEELRAQRINRRMFGIAGEAAYSALWSIRETLREMVKYGGTRKADIKVDADGKVDAEQVYSAVCNIIDEECPNITEVWG